MSHVGIDLHLCYPNSAGTACCDHTVGSTSTLAVSKSGLKGQFTQKLKFCHTPMLFSTLHVVFSSSVECGAQKEMIKQNGRFRHHSLSWWLRLRVNDDKLSF